MKTLKQLFAIGSLAAILIFFVCLLQLILSADSNYWFKVMAVDAVAFVFCFLFLNSLDSDK